MITQKQKTTVLMSLYLLLFTSCNLYAKELLDVTLEEQIQIEGVEQPLLLNGAGIRYKFFFKIYIGALYLAEKNANVSEILQRDQPNRVLMHFVYDEVSREKLVSAWNDGFSSNLSSEAMQQLEPRLQLFNDMFTGVRSGDIILLDYLPGKGTRVSVKGQVKGAIEGADFNRALLSVWLGDDPVTEELKQALLGIED